MGEQFAVSSKLLGETRTISVSLPPSYYDTSLKPTTYPVVYLLDGETNFNYFSTLIEKLGQGIPNVPEMIVIGIENTERERDFATDSDRFWQFVGEELIPFVKKQYRCNDFRILIGHSLSGLAVVSALNKHTELFNAYIAHDPSLWWGKNDGVQLFEANKGKDFKHRVFYMSYSGRKVRNNGRSRHREVIESVQAMVTKGYFKNLETYFAEYPNENHGTVQVIGNIDLMRRLFAEMFIDRNDIQENPAVIQERYKALSKRLHFEFQPSEEYLRNTAKWLRKNGKEAEAKKVLSINN
ncbi:periplasmic siderophore cleavage esterase IroE family protein [Capnocytophaga sp. HP1101]